MRLLIITLFSFFLPNLLLAQPPAGYYKGTDTLTCSKLKSVLKTIISSSISPKTYAALWVQYPKTDIKPRTVDSGSANVIYDIYSTIPGGIDPYQYTPTTDQCGNTGAEGTCYNREHSVPLSWFSGNTSNSGPGTDYNFIFPTDGHVNGKRGNQPYGEVAKVSYTSKNGSKLGTSAVAGFTGDVFEPIDEFKGDVARAFLYFITMYEDNIPSWSKNADAAESFGTTTFPGATIPFLQLMLKWNAEDPVSKKEIDRNNGTYTFQKNRNPFIDSPQYVNRIWNQNCPELTILPVNFVYFTGRLSGRNIQLKWDVNEESNLVEYQLQKSTNASDFITISTVKADGISHYLYNDFVGDDVGNSLLYRLKKVDKSGSFSYSEVFKINLSKEQAITVYPNPARNFIHIDLQNYNSKAVDIILNDVMGKRVFNKSINGSEGQLNIATQNIPNGNYFLKVCSGGVSYSTMVIVAK